MTRKSLSMVIALAAAGLSQAAVSAMDRTEHANLPSACSERAVNGVLLDSLGRSGDVLSPRAATSGPIQLAQSRGTLTQPNAPGSLGISPSDPAAGSAINPPPGVIAPTGPTIGGTIGVPPIGAPGTTLSGQTSGASIGVPGTIGTPTTGSSITSPTGNSLGTGGSTLGGTGALGTGSSSRVGGGVGAGGLGSAGGVGGAAGGGAGR